MILIYNGDSDSKTEKGHLCWPRSCLARSSLSNYFWKLENVTLTQKRRGKQFFNLQRRKAMKILCDSSLKQVNVILASQVMKRRPSSTMLQGMGTRVMFNCSLRLNATSTQKINLAEQLFNVLWTKVMKIL